MGNISSLAAGPFGTEFAGYVQLPYGDFYKGTMDSYGKPHGSRVILLLKSGEVYVGSFSHGERHGHGVFIDVCNNKHEGDWANDQREGREVVRFSNGIVQFNLWKEGYLIDQREDTRGSIETNDEMGYGATDPDKLSLLNAAEDLSDSGDCTRDVAVLGWDVDDVCKWLQSQDCPLDWVDAFRNSRISGQQLMYLDQTSLRNDVGIVKFGERSKILYLISQLRRSNPRSTPSVNWRQPPPSFYINFVELSFMEPVDSPSRFFRGNWLGKDVAIKVYCGQLIRPKLWLKYIVALSELRHPSIALILGVSIDPPYYCVVMEYYHNKSIADWLHGNVRTQFSAQGIPNCSRGEIHHSGRSTTRRRGPMTVQLILRVARSVSVGCAYLRQKSFDHLNLKSTNVLLDESLNAKLTDFGLDRVEKCFSADNIFSEALPATPLPESLRLYHWSSPESLRRLQTFGVDSASDVYSFAIILWEMLTCSLPFREMTNAQVIGAVGYGNDQPPQIHAPNPMKELVRVCLFSEPTVRPKFEEIIERIGTLYESANSSAEDALITFMDGG